MKPNGGRRGRLRCGTTFNLKLKFDWLNRQVSVLLCDISVAYIVRSHFGQFNCLLSEQFINSNNPIRDGGHAEEHTTANTQNLFM